ncbi:hypothetical protein ACN4EI_03330 [Corynebacterium amycolatum]
MTTKKIDSDAEDQNQDHREPEAAELQEDAPAKCIVVNARPLGGVA